MQPPVIADIPGDQIVRESRPFIDGNFEALAEAIGERAGAFHDVADTSALTTLTTATRLDLAELVSGAVYVLLDDDPTILSNWSRLAFASDVAANSLSEGGTIFTTSFTATVNRIHRIDATAATVVVTLPTAPADKSVIVLKQVVAVAPNVVTYQCGGSDVINVAGGSTSGTLTLRGQSAWLQYNATTQIWTVLAADLPLASADARFTRAGLGQQGLVAPSHLRRWRAALNEALFQTAPIAIFGDSIAVGVGSDIATSLDSNYRSWGWVGQLRALFAKTYGDTGEGFIGSPIVDNGSRWTLSGGAIAYQGAGPMHSGAKSASGSQLITVAVPACTQIDFYVWDGGGDGSAVGSYTVDGGSAVTFNAGNGYSDGAGWTKRSITGLSDATHTVVFTGPTATNNLYIAGVVAVRQTVGVPVHRIARSGNTTSNMLALDQANSGLTQPWRTRLLNAIGVVPTAKLVIIALGINDFYQQNNLAQTLDQPGTTPTTYKANLQLAVDAAVSHGAAVLIVWSPRVATAGYPSPMTYVEQLYADAAAQVAAATDHCAMIDIASAWGGNRTTADDLGLTTAGTVHPPRAGHGDMARIIHSVLTSPALG